MGSYWLISTGLLSRTRTFYWWWEWLHNTVNIFNINISYIKMGMLVSFILSTFYHINAPPQKKTNNVVKITDLEGWLWSLFSPRETFLYPECTSPWLLGLCGYCSCCWECLSHLPSILSAYPRSLSSFLSHPGSECSPTCFLKACPHAWLSHSAFLYSDFFR